MKNIPLCLLAVLALAACDKPEPQDEAEKSAPPKSAAQRVPTSPTPMPNDWMWKNSKGKPRNNPLSVKDNALDETSKKSR